MVYFIQNTKTLNVKIGITQNNLSARLSTLQVASAEKLEVILVLEGGAELEHKLHVRFDKYRLSGEWFEYSDPLKKYLALNQRKGLFKEIINTAPKPVLVKRKSRQELTPGELLEYRRLYAKCFGDYEMMALVGNTPISKIRLDFLPYKPDTELSKAHRQTYPNFHLMSVDARLALFEFHHRPDITLELLNPNR